VVGGNNALYKCLKARWRVRCKIEPQESLYVGVGRSDFSIAAVELPFAKIFDQNSNSWIPVIPGSGLKGAFRAYFSRLINSLSIDILNEFGFKGTLMTDETNFERDFVKTKGVQEKLKKLKSAPTIFKLFGISGFASLIKFTDALPERSLEKHGLIRRTHVRIDINTDKAVQNALFDLEAIVKGYTFTFDIIYDELDDEILKDANELFNLMIKLLKRGLEIHIGGMKSRGYGLVKITAVLIERFTPKDLFFGNKPQIVYQKDEGGI